jgi:iron complex outermembrane receptor protein
MADRSTWTWVGSTGQQALPDYFKLDGGIYYEKDKVRITANMLNITDKYLYSGSAYAAYYYWQAEPGRNFRVGVSYRF